MQWLSLQLRRRLVDSESVSRYPSPASCWPMSWRITNSSTLISLYCDEGLRRSVSFGDAPESLVSYRDLQTILTSIPVGLVGYGTCGAAEVRPVTDASHEGSGNFDAGHFRIPVRPENRSNVKVAVLLVDR